MPGCNARDLVYHFVNERAAAGLLSFADGPEDRELEELLNQVEDDRAHAEAEKLRREGDSWGQESAARKVYYHSAELIDPYEMLDGQLVRKSDGKTVII